MKHHHLIQQNNVNFNFRDSRLQHLITDNMKEGSFKLKIKNVL